MTESLTLIHQEPIVESVEEPTIELVSGMSQPVKGEINPCPPNTGMCDPNIMCRPRTEGCFPTNPCVPQVTCSPNLGGPR